MHEGPLKTALASWAPSINIILLLLLLLYILLLSLARMKRNRNMDLNSICCSRLHNKTNTIIAYLQILFEG